MENLKVNQLMEIVIEGDNFREYYPVRIENIDERSIQIGMPMKQGGIVRLQIGQEIRCIFRSSNSNYYGFSTTITNIIKKPFPMLITDKPSQLSTINQKRAYVRLEVTLPIEYRLINHDDDSEDGSEALYHGHTVNISAGGVLFSTNVRLETQQHIDIKLYLPQYDPFCCKAKVLRVFDKVDFKRENIWVAIQYEEISDAKRDQLFNFIFEKQREFIKAAYKR